MVEMKCPACGAEGRAPKDKINTRLVCKKCLRVFHLTPSGRAVIGEPPQQVVAPVKAADPTEKLEIALNFEWLGGIIRALMSPKASSGTRTFARIKRWTSSRSAPASTSFSGGMISPS